MFSAVPVFVLVVLLFTVAGATCAPAPKKTEPITRASVYCETLGYKTGVGQTEGGIRPVCVFPEGTHCEQWSFYQGRCGKQYSKCAKNGFILRHRAEGREKDVALYAVCLFDDGSECVEQDYAAGHCKRTDCKKWSFAAGGCVRAEADL